MARPDPQDAADIRRVLAGDELAFEGLIERHGRRAYDLARRMLRDAHEAEDAVQHAFLNAFKALERFDMARPFRHWILRITSNLCRNRIASRKVRGKLLDPTGGDDERPDPVARGADRPDAQLEGPEQERVRAAIDALPEKYRLVVVLRYLNDLPLDEIADIAGIPMATVKTHLHRGRAALRALLAPETDEPENGMEG